MVTVYLPSPERWENDWRTKIIDFRTGGTGCNWLNLITSSLISLTALALLLASLYGLIGSGDITLSIVGLFFGFMLGVPGAIVLVGTVQAMRHPTSILLLDGQDRQLRVIENKEVVDSIPFSEISHIHIAYRVADKNPDLYGDSILINIKGPQRPIEIGKLSGIKFWVKRRMQAVVRRVSDLTGARFDKELYY
jgi:hypothetical protein